MAVRHLDRGDLLGRGAVIVHMAHKGRREALPGALPAVRAVVQHVACDRCRRTRTGAADAHLRIAVHRAEDRHRLAAAGLDQPDRDADQCLGRRSAAHHVHVEVEADAEITGDKRRRGRVAARIRQDAVDIGGLQPGIEDRVAHGPRPERPGRLTRAAGVGRLPNTGDRIFVAQIFWCGGVNFAPLVTALAVLPYFRRSVALGLPSPVLLRAVPLPVKERDPAQRA